MAYEFCESDLKQIAKLPTWIQALKLKYPVSVINTADAYDDPPLPEGYVPEYVEIFYGDGTDNSDVFIRDGKLHSFNAKDSVNTNIIQLDVDGQCAYIQVEGQVLLDRLGGVVLPEVLVDPEVLLHSLT